MINLERCIYDYDNGRVYELDYVGGNGLFYFNYYECGENDELIFVDTKHPLTQREVKALANGEILLEKINKGEIK